MFLWFITNKTANSVSGSREVKLIGLPDFSREPGSVSTPLLLLTSLWVNKKLSVVSSLGLGRGRVPLYLYSYSYFSSSISIYLLLCSIYLYDLPLPYNKLPKNTPVHLHLAVKLCTVRFTRIFKSLKLESEIFLVFQGNAKCWMRLDLKTILVLVVVPSCEFSPLRSAFYDLGPRSWRVEGWRTRRREYRMNSW